jgi:hypothetical protein
MGIDTNAKWIKSGTPVLTSEYPPQQPNTPLSCTVECGMRINLFPNRTIQSVTLIDYINTGRPYTLTLCLFNSSNMIVSNTTKAPTTTTTTLTSTITTTTTTTQMVATQSCAKIKPVFISSDYTPEIFNLIVNNLTNISIGK